MAMEEDLRTRLLGLAAVSAAGAKVSWFERPRGANNAIELQGAGSTRYFTHDGPDGFQSSRVQFDCWSKSSATARALGEAVLAEMERIGVTVGGTRFLPAFLENSFRDVEDEAGTPFYRVMLDMRFEHQPA